MRSVSIVYATTSRCGGVGHYGTGLVLNFQGSVADSIYRVLTQNLPPYLADNRPVLQPKCEQYGGFVFPDETVAGRHPKRCRCQRKVSQVCKKSRTCDGFCLLWPIYVAVQPENADLRRFVP